MKVICNKCGEPKPETSEFFRPHGHAKGFRGACRECEAKIQREDRNKSPERRAAHAEAARKWSRENPEKRNATKRKWRQDNIEKHNAIARKSNYGITDPQYQEIFKLQDGKCAICGFIFPGQNTGDRTLSPHVDHCHKSGKIRGLLCNNCNRGLGAFKDRYEFLDAASLYLKIVG